VSTSGSGGDTTFFDASQSYLLNTAATYSNTLTSQGYKFTYSQDKLVGRPVTVVWPAGLMLQAVTGVPLPASLTVSRVDKQVFSITKFTVRLICGTLATDADIEVFTHSILFALTLYVMHIT